jgi:hypothetical protein
VKQDAGNEVLAALLAELGWTPRALGRRINRVSGVGTVAETAPYHWRDAGGVPRPPLPALAAWVLSCELGRPVTIAELWQGRAADSPLTLPADVEMDQPWTRAGALSIIDDWVVSGLLDRRFFLSVSASALTALAFDYPALAPGGLARALSGQPVGHPLLEQIEQSIPLLQRLDDVGGGGTHLAYVGAQFRAVALLIRQGGHPDPVERRLFAALAEIGQLAGWMAVDAGKHGLAQRYFFTALRATHESGYRSMAAHVLADLAFQAATRGHAANAIGLGEAAVGVAVGVPATVRASVATRLAYGYAIAGRIGDFDRAYHAGLDALAHCSDAEQPAWMYFLTPSHLDTQAGYALTHAGVLARGADDLSAERSLLRRGSWLLRTGAHAISFEHAAQRRALFEGAWLAVAAASQDDLEQACSIGQVAVARIQTVRSHRSTEVLAVLAGRLRRRSRNEHVAGFLPALETALAGKAGPA